MSEKESEAQSKRVQTEPTAASYSELSDSASGQGVAPLATILDVALPVTIEFGRAHLSVQRILELGNGSVIQLDRMVGEPVDIYVSDQKLGEGEVVVIGEYFGVRITEVVKSQAAVADTGRR